VRYTAQRKRGESSQHSHPPAYAKIIYVIKISTTLNILSTT
jgi:hypothetical protein